MRNNRIQRLVVAGLSTGIIALGGVIAGPVVSGASVTSHTNSTFKTPFPVQSVPNSVFPFYTAAACTTTNIDYWNLMYRPGYWYGLGSSTALQPNLSSLTTASITYPGSDTLATINIAPWVWSNTNGTLTSSNHETQDNQMVDFWLNMDKAQTGSQALDNLSYTCGYVPGDGLPDQVISVTNVGGLTGHQITIEFSGHISSGWLQTNSLSQIDPMPYAWDITHSGGAPSSGGCSTEAFASVTNNGSDQCTTVFNYLSGLQINNSLWNWANGPYRQSAAPYANGSPTGQDVMVANTHYSDTAHDAVHAVKTIDFEEYSSTNAEILQLDGGHLDTGFVDPPDLSAASPTNCSAGHNLLTHVAHYYNVEGGCIFGVFYWYFNFGSSHSTWPADPATNVWAAEMNQQYVRDAMAKAVNQTYLSDNVNNGYSIPTYDALPFSFTSAQAGGTVTNPNPFSTSAAKSLLEAHGWTLSSGLMECTNPGSGSGQCGADIPMDAHLSFNVLVPAGDTTVQTQTNDEQAELDAAGFDISATFESANDVQAACFGGASEWQLCGYGGWIYDPDFYPSGEELFATGAGSNSGGYSNAEMDGLIADSTTGGDIKLAQTDPNYGTSYAAFTAQDMPVLWQPTPKTAGELLKTVRGLPAANPLGDFNPEFVTAI